MEWLLELRPIRFFSLYLVLVFLVGVWRRWQQYHTVLTLLVRFRSRWPEINFNVNSGSPDTLMRDVKQGDLDVALAVTETEPPIEPRHAWRRAAVWVRSDATKLDPQRPVPLVSYAEDCACQRVTIAALFAMWTIPGSSPIERMQASAASKVLSCSTVCSVVNTSDDAMCVKVAARRR